MGSEEARSSFVVVVVVLIAVLVAVFVACLDRLPLQLHLQDLTATQVVPTSWQILQGAADGSAEPPSDHCFALNSPLGMQSHRCRQQETSMGLETLGVAC